MPPSDEIRIERQPEGRDQATRARPTARRNPRTAWRIAAIALVLAAACGGVWYFHDAAFNDQSSTAPGDARSAAPAPTAPIESAGENRPGDGSDAQFSSAREFVVQDDGRLLWASPTHGLPISLSYLPNGARVLLHLRSADLTAHSGGEQVWAALGPWGERALAELQRLTLCQLHEIDVLTVAVLTNSGGDVHLVLRAELLQPWDEQQLRQRNPSGRPQPRGEETLWVDGAVGRWLPARSSGKTLVVGAPAMLQELIDWQGAPPLLPRDLGAILRSTDADRTLTLALDPRFLQASGSDVLSGSASPLRDALTSILGRDASAAAVSADWGDRFFVELRVIPSVNIPAHHYVAQLAQRIERAPTSVEPAIHALPAGAYGRRLVERLPQMLQQAGALMRRGADHAQAVIRIVLPESAGQNLIAAAELLLARPGAATASASDSPPANEEILARKTSLQVRGESLEDALQMLAADLGVPIEIRGRDLQREGITRNQTLNFDLRDQTAEEILTTIVRQANPDPSVTSLADPAQKLVYVLQPRDDRAGPALRIIVTTRAAAARRGDKLPQVFVESDR